MKTTALILGLAASAMSAQAIAINSFTHLAGVFEFTFNRDDTFVVDVEHAGPPFAQGQGFEDPDSGLPGGTMGINLIVTELGFDLQYAWNRLTGDIIPPTIIIPEGATAVPNLLFDTELGTGTLTWTTTSPVASPVSDGGMPIAMGAIGVAGIMALRKRRT
jgi:hypothetical protein